MITLITGIPGMGKTSLCLDMMLKEREGRPLFVMGVNDLKIEHFPTPPVEEWTEMRPDKDDPSLLLPYFTFPEKSILIVDECQRVFRPRAAGSKVPPYVAAFETHRHTGIDIWLLTQDPALIDSNIRRLVGRHIHIRPTPMGRQLYEWKQVHDPESKADRDIAARKKYSPPKHVFHLYKSAEAHTKQPFRIPRPLMIFGACLAIGAYLAYGSWQAIGGKINPPKTHPVSNVQSVSSPIGAPLQSQPLQVAKPYSDEAFIPRNLNRPESAPAYDELRQVTAMPIIAGCIASSRKCLCYTQQGTPIELIQEEYCRKTADNPEFNPYASPQNQQAATALQNRIPPPVIMPAGAL